MSVYEGEAPPRLRWEMWKKFAIGGLLETTIIATSLPTVTCLGPDASIT